MNHAKQAVLGLFFTSVLLSGCTAPATTAGSTKETPKAVQQEKSTAQEPPVYSGIGSWIPRKVKKKEDVIGTNTQTVSGEALAKAQQQGTTHVTKEPLPPPGR